jgi:hypothetical protein
METIRQNPVMATVLGGLVVVIALIVLVLLLTGGGDSGPDLAAFDLPTTTGTASDLPTTTGTVSAQATTDGSRFPGPNIEQIACGPLLTFEDVDAALGTMDWLTVSGGETCTHQLLEDDATFVRIQPGHPTDLIDGTLEAASGRPLSDVGDAAIWFSETGTLSVAAQSRFGIVVFRITVARTDLDEAERLEIAKDLAAAALPRFPGIDAPPPLPPEEVVVTIEHEAPDQADQTYVANLLAREAEGDWSRGEGLIATLRLFVGEAWSSQVTPTRTIAEQSATGIIRMAQSYLETASDPGEVAELERLLGLLLPADLRPLEATASSQQPAIRDVSFPSAQEDPDGCFSVWPQHGDPCFKWTDIVPEFGGKYRFGYPDLDEWEGWVRGPSSPISEAIRKTARFLEGLDGDSPRMDIALGPFNTGSSVQLTELWDGYCQIVLNKGAQILRDVDPALLQQSVAATMGMCYLSHNFGYDQQLELAASYYLSDVVYPDASMETVVFKIPATLGGEELRTTLTERSLTNMPFFEYVDSARGLDGALEAYEAMVQGGPSAVSGIDDLWHDYVEALTDGVIIDQAGAHPFGPGAQRFDASPGLRINAEPRAFGLERIQLTVPSGMYACMEYPDEFNLDLIASWRPGSPGEGGSWSTSLPESLEGTASFVVTAGEADGLFGLKVRDVKDNPDCEDDEDEESGSPGPPGPPCGYCDPTSFYSESVEEWLMRIVEGRGPTG